MKTLRWLILPFVILFAVMLGFAIPHANLHVVKTSGDWQAFTEALAFTIALSGLGWAECGNDYTRYCPTNTSKKGIVGWVFLGTAVPEILIMTLGAVVGTFVLNIGTGAGGFLPFAHQSAIPSWFVVVFLLFAVVQLFGINSLDMYSSGVTMQAIGIPVKRYQAVVIDCVIALGITMWAIFSGSFTEYLSDFVDLVIVWIAPWSAIFLVDWALRRYRYVPSELQKTGRTSLYWRRGGVFWPAIIAQVVGMYAAISALYVNPTYYFRVPRWMNEVTDHTQDAYHYGGDFSVFLGMGVAALVYLVLAVRKVRKEADAQEALSRKRGFWPRCEAGGRGPPSQSQSSTRPPEGSGRNSGMVPRVRTRAASSPSARRQPPPSVMSVPMTTGSASRRRTRRRADDSEAPVEMTSSTTATRRPRTAPTRAGSMRRRCGASVVMEYTGSAHVSPRWILGVLCRIT